MPDLEGQQPVRHVRRIEGTSNWEVVPEPSSRQRLTRLLGMQSCGNTYYDQEIARLQIEVDREEPGD